MISNNLQSCQEQLAALQKEYEEFAYIVSHDLKAPLRAINNLSGWIQEDLGEGIDPDVDSNIKLLQNRVERMERMINAILLFSRVNRTDLTITEVDVHALVSEIVKVLEQKHQVTVEMQGEKLPILHTYSAKLRTVLENIIENAVQYTDKETVKLQIDAFEQEGLYTFVIKDNGPGLPQETLEKIFNLFYTAQPKDKLENVGAGLTISRKIVQFVGGNITASSNIGEGVEITFSWPAHVE